MAKTYDELVPKLVRGNYVVTLKNVIYRYTTPEGPVREYRVATVTHNAHTRERARLIAETALREKRVQSASVYDPKTKIRHLRTRGMDTWSPPFPSEIP